MTPERAGYALFVSLALLVGWWIRRIEGKRLDAPRGRQNLGIAAGALLGGVIGAKLLMILYLPVGEWWTLIENLMALNFDGKTVIGGLTGGYIGVEVAKRLVGVTRSTGDAYAVALPVAHGIGRLGCLWNGCCYGREADIFWGVFQREATRHPAQVYEMLGNFALAAFLWSYRKKTSVPGQLVRMYLVGYALIRVVIDPFRGDSHIPIGPLTLVQWYCLVMGAGFAWWVSRDMKRPALAAE